MPFNPLTTAQDLLERVLVACNVVDTSFTPNVAKARQAVIDAVRELPGFSSWEYFKRNYDFYTSAQQTTGTVRYVSSTRALTLTGATWPDDVRLYRIILDGKHYDISSRVSSTVVTLGPSVPPGDVASGSSYTLYRGLYPLPINCQAVLSVFDRTTDQRLGKVTAQQEQSLTNYLYDQPGEIERYAIRNKGEILGQMSLQFVPPPYDARRVEILYQAAPLPINLFKYDTGTLAATDGSTTVTLSGGTWPEGIEGSVLRFSSTSTKPTPIRGGMGTSDNPFAYERIVQSRLSATQVTIDADVGDLSGVGYTLSNNVDIDHYPMLDAVFKLALYHFKQEANYQPDATGIAESRFQKALEKAIARDSAMSMYAHSGPHMYRPFVDGAAAEEVG